MNIWMILFQVFNAVSAIYIYCLFFGAFSEKREFKSRNLALIGLSIIWSAVLIFMPGSTIRSAIIIFMIICLSFTYYNNWYKNILLSLLVFCLPGLIEIIVAILLMIFGIETSSSDQNTFLVIGTLISKILSFSIVHFVRIKNHKLGNVGKWYYFYFGILSISSTLAAIILLDYIFIAEQLHMRIITILSVWLLLFLNILIFYIFDKINNLYNAEKDLIVSKRLIEEQKHYYEDIINEQENFSKIRHDIKNSLIGVLSKINNRDVSGSKQSLELLLNDLDLSSTGAISQDVALNTILTIKKNEAIKHNIQFIYEEHIIGTISIDPIDLCVLMGNALDNAIEACAKLVKNEKRIEIFILIDDLKLVLSIKNTVDKRINTNNISTNKTDVKNHGFGIPRIRELSSKYNGDINIECSNDSFELNMILLNE
ncbi:MAG: sensor histidine kinase [Clostridia bacterium]|nr:sensor histidine kinase [Clostridia bacterium]